MIQTRMVEQPVQISCVRMPPVEVQKETQTQLLRFAQIDLNSLFQPGLVEERSVRPRTPVDQNRCTRSGPQLLAGERLDSSSRERKCELVRHTAGCQFYRDAFVLLGLVPESADAVAAFGRRDLDSTDRTVPKEVERVQQRGLAGPVRAEDDIDGAHVEFDIGEGAVVSYANSRQSVQRITARISVVSVPSRTRRTDMSPPDPDVSESRRTAESESKRAARFRQSMSPGL